VAPAIANAVYDAVGVRIKDLPITAEKVFRALQAQKTENKTGSRA
jgi:CO/xanthine dehydrogenase Mo-binding subunit